MKNKKGILLAAKQYGRRSRPRAKSLDSPCMSGDENFAIERNRSYSLDSNPQYQFILYGTSVPFLTSGYSVSLKPSKQNSLVTIFAIWNTIIGSSLLAMPWSVQRAGLAVALVLMLFVSTLAVYTAYRVLTVQFLHGDQNIGEVPYLCKVLLGKWAELTARIFSFVIIFGANIVYWILMSNCLYHSVGYLTDILFGTEMNSMNLNNTVLCPSDDVVNSTTADIEKTLFQKVWNLETTVPLFLVIIVAPLLNFKSATFFTKFNSIGTLSVIYLFIFVLIKSFSWGVNVDLMEPENEHYVNLYETTFFATSGMLPLSLFIHNIVITLMKNNRDQQNNSRDLSIAYVLVVLTYLLIGFTFYICFPLKKSCIEDNMLNNFPDWDVTTVVARIFLFFQLLTVYPLLSYMLRIQVFSALNYPSYPSAFYVMILNLVNIFGCVLFAIFLPRIGTIIRFTGAICGFVYIFTLPCLLYMASKRERKQLNTSTIILHSCIPVIGLVNLVAQFYVSDSY
ncbi:sodium-coupled neutral amino acid transporter 9 homolog isoform X2 [Planococcus citri]|uniref:sodium-coupled neutral amino acid transporter 9 homolog isoform X2 n=1 Tax=Planococcus citri TaxID=170843 RepID=UPI0031F96E82